MRQIPTENSSHAIPPVENPSYNAHVPVEVEEWQATRLNLMLMLNNEFNEDYEEIKVFLKEHEGFNVEKDIGFIDEYPLSIDYIKPNVNDTPPYWLYLISYGGPGSEIRFFVDNQSSTEPYKVEFCFLDSSDIVKRDVTSEDIIEHLWEQVLLPGAEQMKPQSGLTSFSEEIANSETQKNTGLVRTTEETDPQLALAGTLERDVRKTKRQFKNSVRPTARVVKGAYADDPDPLIALLGTLECDVTDIGKRHDDYIGDALLAELWGDENE